MPAPRQIRDGDAVLKVANAFLAQDERSVLLECLAIEGYLRQTFLVQVLPKHEGVLLRLLPLWMPEKTPGVVSTLAWIARSIVDAFPGCRISTNNLGISTQPG
ncbi:MAG: hypothetical protein ACE15D_16200 [Candidatus Eisenbacteria bacterium]